MINIDIDYFRARVLQDCLTEATAMYWLRRAQQFEDAAPRQGDYHGHASREELIDARERCKATALACRRRAQLIMEGRPEEITADVRAAIQDVA